MMTTKETFIRANEELIKIVQKIKDDQWQMEMPKDFPSFSDQPMKVRYIINYHAYDDAWVPDMLDGKTMEEVGKDKFDGDLLGEEPKANFKKYAEAAKAAVRKFNEMNQIIHFSYGDFPAWDALMHITMFRGIRVYDLAKALGQDTQMPDDLVNGLWEMTQPHAEEWRSIGIFGPKVEVSTDAPLQDQLLGLTGRQP